MTVATFSLVVPGFPGFSDFRIIGPNFWKQLPHPLWASHGAGSENIGIKRSNSGHHIPQTGKTKTATRLGPVAV